MTAVWPCTLASAVPSPHGACSLWVFSGRTSSSARGRLHLGPPWGLLGACNDLGVGSLEMGYRFVELGLGLLKIKAVDPSKRWAVKRMANRLGT